MFLVFKIILSSIIIGVSTEVARRNPSIGGWILSLPLVSIIAFSLMGYQGASANALGEYAKSTLIFVPLSLVFFLPFALPFFHASSFIFKFFLGLGTLSLLNIIFWKFAFIKF